MKQYDVCAWSTEMMSVLFRALSLGLAISARLPEDADPNQEDRYKLADAFVVSLPNCDVVLPCSWLCEEDSIVINYVDQELRLLENARKS